MDPMLIVHLPARDSIPHFLTSTIRHNIHIASAWTNVPIYLRVLAYVFLNVHATKTICRKSHMFQWVSFRDAPNSCGSVAIQSVDNYHKSEKSKLISWLANCIKKL